MSAQTWFLAKKFMDRDHWHAVKRYTQTPERSMVSYCGIQRRPSEVETLSLGIATKLVAQDGQRICRVCSQEIYGVPS